MLNNLTNYPDLIKLKAIVDVPQDTDLITLGVRNPNYDGNYRPALNTYRDFADSILAQVPASIADVNAAYTLYVDLVYGNNTTAQVGSIAKPYRTIAAATAAAVALGSSIPIIIHLRPGQYNEGIVFRDKIYYYAENGVVFYTSGASDTTLDQQAVSGLFGYAQFTGSASITLNYGCTLTIEFDKTNNATINGFFQIVNGNVAYSPKINISCNSLYTTAANANGCRVRGKVDLTLNVKESIKAPYSVIDVRGQGSINSYTGNLTVNCPAIIIEDGGQFGNNASFKQCLITYAVAATSIITINGNLYNEVTNTTFMGSNSACISDWSGSNAYVLRVNGNIYAGTQRAILNNGGSKQLIQGNISTSSIVATVLSGVTTIKNSTIVKTDSTDSNAAFRIGTAVDLFISDSTIYNANTVGVTLISFDNSSSRFFGTNVINQNVTTAQDFLSAGGQVGLINVQSNRANGVITSLYTATGFTQEANLVVPKYL